MAQLSRKDTAYRIDALAETFGVKERLEQRAWMLSSGEQQRVSLVRAMIRQPQVLLLTSLHARSTKHPVPLSGRRSITFAKPKK